jgi:DNA-binding transcriptional MerR regulator
MPETLLTIEQTAERLRVATKTLRLWKRQGKGPQPRKLGSRLVYRESDVDSFVAELFEEEPA